MARGDTMKAERRPTELEQALLRDWLLERGFSMTQIRRAVRALTPGAISMTKSMLEGPWTALARSTLTWLRGMDRGIEYEHGKEDDTPFPVRKSG